MISMLTVAERFVQASWRSWVSREASKQECKEQWKKDFGKGGECVFPALTEDWELSCGSVGGHRVARGDNSLADCLRRLCYFVEPEEWEDVVCLANVVGACLKGKDGNVSNGILGLLDWVTGDLGARLVVIRNLFQTAIACIAGQRDRFKDFLCLSLRQIGLKFEWNKGIDFESISDGDERLVVGRILKPLIDLVVGLVSFQGKEEGIESDQLLQIKKELFTAKWIPERRRVGTVFIHVSEILSCCNERNAGGGCSRDGPSAAESLATSCIVRYINCFGTFIYCC